MYFPPLATQASTLELPTTPAETKKQHVDHPTLRGTAPPPHPKKGTSACTSDPPKQGSTDSPFKRDTRPNGKGKRKKEVQSVTKGISPPPKKKQDGSSKGNLDKQGPSPQNRFEPRLGQQYLCDPYHWARSIKRLLSAAESHLGVSMALKPGA